MRGSELTTKAATLQGDTAEYRRVLRCRVHRIAQGRLASPTRGCRYRRTFALYVFWLRRLMP
jgi:hypothetical protein